jgi:uncharacterized membrane protein (Fun14 family)
MDSSAGNRPARFLLMDARGVFWIPTAILIALVMSTPIPTRRRVASLLVGLAIMNLFYLATMGIYILSEADQWPDVAIVRLDPFWKWVMAGLEESFVTQMGPGLAVPVLIWALVTFKRGDLGLLSESP